MLCLVQQLLCLTGHAYTMQPNWRRLHPAKKIHETHKFVQQQITLETKYNSPGQQDSSGLACFTCMHSRFSRVCMQGYACKVMRARLCMHGVCSNNCPPLSWFKSVPLTTRARLHLLMYPPSQSTGFEPVQASLTDDLGSSKTCHRNDMTNSS